MEVGAKQTNLSKTGNNMCSLLAKDNLDLNVDYYPTRQRRRGDNKRTEEETERRQ